MNIFFIEFIDEYLICVNFDGKYETKHRCYRTQTVFSISPYGLTLISTLFVVLGAKLHICANFKR